MAQDGGENIRGFWVQQGNRGSYFQGRDYCQKGRYVNMNYFTLLRRELLRQFLSGLLTKEQASAIAQRINREQADYFGREKK
jgi:hypothetical protein